ncbi:MAG: hypothetical protein DMG65_22315 [Candidatus Angelobacter sp. Gp1-AA117]|nr:MAG: hypothetical protein DMG65_22315 [Candidatus Angelobacter sp. Gp1-AA117]
MYNQQILDLARGEIEQQIQSMPAQFTSFDFYTAFAANHSRKYQQLIRIYTQRHDRPHAIQILHSQLMHTVNDRFSHLVRKTHTIANPKGGDMSAWVKA